MFNISYHNICTQQKRLRCVFIEQTEPMLWQELIKVVRSYVQVYTLNVYTI